LIHVPAPQRRTHRAQARPVAADKSLRVPIVRDRSPSTLLT